jgi:thymidine phosphorylase
MHLADGLAAKDFDEGRLAVWLALTVRRGLTENSLSSLTYALRDSGDVLDIRETLRPLKLVRRYPTGTISEKVALTLPALLSLASGTSGTVAPVIVARGLGFAGGTWDKLAQIPGFLFLDPDRIAHALADVGAAYLVPNSSLAPADRELYSFRAMTGTVQSLPLIAASIASKHLAMPVDTLLLDMQFGSVGFVSDRAAAARLAKSVARLSATAGMSVAHHARDSALPTGSCIGPPAELWEALAVMGATGPAYASLDRRMVESQRHVTSENFGLLLAQAGLGNTDELAAQGRQRLRSGQALVSFRRILQTHCVTSDTVSALFSDPLQVLRCKNQTVVRSPASGQVVFIDLRKIGLIVNMGYGTAQNDFAFADYAAAGVQLHVQAGDAVTKGQPLCTIHGVPEPAFDLTTCFTVAQ